MLWTIQSDLLNFGKERKVPSRSSAGSLIADTVNSNYQLTQIKSNGGFWRKGKPEYPQKTSRSREANQQTQPTYDAGSGNRTRATMVGGECSHHCAIPARPRSPLACVSGGIFLISCPIAYCSQRRNCQRLSASRDESFRESESNILKDSLSFHVLIRDFKVRYTTERRCLFFLSPSLFPSLSPPTLLPSLFQLVENKKCGHQGNRP